MEALVLIIVFGSISFILYSFLSTRHKERMALIEQAEDPAIFNILNRSRARGKGTLKFGILFLFAGAGLFSSYFISELFNIPEELSFFAMLLLGTGSGLLFYHFIDAKNHLENEERHPNDKTV